MPHTTPWLLASTTRRWPPICRQNLGGERGGRRDPSRAAQPSAPRARGGTHSREQGRRICWVSQEQGSLHWQGGLLGGRRAGCAATWVSPLWPRPRRCHQRWFHFFNQEWLNKGQARTATAPSWSHTRLLGPHWLWVTFWGQNQGPHVPTETAGAQDAIALPPVGGLVPPSASKCPLQSQALHPDTWRLFSGVACPDVSLRVFTQAQGHAGPGTSWLWRASRKRGRGPLGPSPWNRRGAVGWEWPGPCPPGARPTHIWSHGSGRSGASRSGLGSLTKMSPLQVMDQMAWGEGRPRTLRLSQQDRLSRASWRGQTASHHWEEDGPRLGGLSLLPLGPWETRPTHPVIHVLLGGGSQTHRPPLPGPFGGVQGEGVLGLIEHGDQRGHLVEEHM